MRAPKIAVTDEKSQHKEVPSEEPSIEWMLVAIKFWAMSVNGLPPFAMTHIL